MFPVKPTCMNAAEHSNLERILKSPSYVRASDDLQFLHREELRPVRLMLELMKPELIQQAHGVKSTIVVFGGTRIVERKMAEERLAAAEAAVAESVDHAAARKAVDVAQRILAKARYYEVARELGRIVSSRCQVNGQCDMVVVTGGGPGVMEAANRGAADVLAKSMGLNITLPHEQAPNPYITPELCFQFQYFALRKMHFLLRAKALVAFPGGYGTLDELFETLTLIQTGKMPRVPILLVGKWFWQRLIDWQFLVEEGTISPEDVNLFDYAETAEEVWEKIVSFHGPSMLNNGLMAK
jgi:uncharacterized protein (TIGR00730 family)